MVITADVNPVDVRFTHDVSCVEELSLDYFKIAGIDPLAPPRTLYLKVDGDPNVRADLAIPSENRAVAGSGYGRLTSLTVPLYYKLGHATNILHGKQCKETRWRMGGLKNMTGFRATLVDYDGTPFVLPPTCMFQLVFSVKYLTQDTSHRRNLSAWS